MNTSNPQRIHHSTPLLLAVLLCLGAVPGSVRAEEPAAEKTRCRLAFLSNAFQGASRGDVAAALPVYIEELSDAIPGIVASAKVIDTLEEATKGMADGTIDIVICRSIDFVRHQAEWDSSASYTPVRSGFSVQRYLLLTAKKDVLDVGTLRGATLTLPEDDELADVYLESVVQAAGGESVESFFGTIVREEKPANSMLKVLMGKSESCLVEESTYSVMAEMNPQVKKRLHAVARSAGFPVAAAACRNGFPREVLAKITVFLTEEMHTTQRGKQILTLFRSDGMAAIADVNYDPVRQLLRESGEAVVQGRAPAGTKKKTATLASDKSRDSTP